MNDEVVNIKAQMLRSELVQLEALAGRMGKTMSDVIRKAVHRERHLQGVLAAGGKVLTVDKYENIQELIEQ